MHTREEINQWEKKNASALKVSIGRLQLEQVGLCLVRYLALERWF